MPHCYTVGCRNSTRSTAAVSYHSFPKDNRLRTEWLTLIGRNPNSTIIIYEKVCSDHFNENDIKLVNNRKYLIPCAVPVQNLPSRWSDPRADQILNLPRSLTDLDLPLALEPVRKKNRILVDVVTEQTSLSLKTDEPSCEPSCISFISNEPDNLPEVMPVSKSSVIPTQSKTMTRPLNSSAVKNALVADEAEQKAEYIARRTLDQNKEKMRSLRRKNRQLKRKIEKINNIFNELGKQCDINEVSKQLSIIPCSSNPIPEDSSTESDVDEPYRLDNNLQENVKVNANKSDMAVADNEEAATQINCHNMESQVQVTFLAGSDTAKEGLLKRKLKQLAENDVIKSKKIRELHNILFVKNKLIAELKSEIAQLKEFQKNQVQRPIIQYIVRKS